MRKVGLWPRPQPAAYLDRKISLSVAYSSQNQAEGGFPWCRESQNGRKYASPG